MMTSIDNLREISRRCKTGDPLSEELSYWLGASLLEFLDQRCPTIDEALGLKFPQGGVPWWREEAIRKRDAALRELAACHCEGRCPTAQAEWIHTLSIRYAASSWRHDRDREGMPRDYRGSPKQFLWRAFKSRAAMPLGKRQLRHILGH